MLALGTAAWTCPNIQDSRISGPHKKGTVSGLQHTLDQYFGFVRYEQKIWPYRPYPNFVLAIKPNFFYGYVSPCFCWQMLNLVTYLYSQISSWLQSPLDDYKVQHVLVGHTPYFVNYLIFNNYTQRTEQKTSAKKWLKHPMATRFPRNISSN